MTAMSATFPAQYEALLVQLHSEMRAGRSDEARASELRSEMAAVWYRLSEDEQAIYDELSEDLYILEGKRVPVPLSEGETAVLVAQRLASAFKAKENRRALELIRKLTSIDASLSYVMGRCWERAGFLRASVCFYDFANEQEPNAIYEALALAMLVQAGALDEAAARAQAIEKRPVVSGTLLLKVASVLHQTAAKAEVSQRPAIYARVTRLVEVAWDDRTAPASTRAEGLVVAGFSYEHLGDKDQALRSFERAVAVHPSGAPLCARGLALLHIDRPRALRDLTDAAKLGTRLDWPYLYAAQHAIEVRRFAEVERFCEAGLAFAQRAELRGRLFEWWAIAAIELGRPPAEITALFEQAMAELPLDLVLHRNVRMYRKWLETERTIPSEAWEVASADLDEEEARASLTG